MDSRRKSFLAYGRRTGINVLEGKSIRKYKDGRDYFEDYWTDSNDSESVLSPVSRSLRKTSQNMNTSKSSENIKGTPKNKQKKLEQLSHACPSETDANPRSDTSLEESVNKLHRKEKGSKSKKYSTDKSEVQEVERYLRSYISPAKTASVKHSTPVKSKTRTIGNEMFILNENVTPISLRKQKTINKKNVESQDSFNSDEAESDSSVPPLSETYTKVKSTISQFSKSVSNLKCNDNIHEISPSIKSKTNKFNKKASRVLKANKQLAKSSVRKSNDSLESKKNFSIYDKYDEFIMQMVSKTSEHQNETNCPEQLSEQPLIGANRSPIGKGMGNEQSIIHQAEIHDDDGRNIDEINDNMGIDNDPPSASKNSPSVYSHSSKQRQSKLIEKVLENEIDDISVRVADRTKRSLTNFIENKSIEKQLQHSEIDDSITANKKGLLEKSSSFLKVSKSTNNTQNLDNKTKRPMKSKTANKKQNANAKKNKSKSDFVTKPLNKKTRYSHQTIDSEEAGIEMELMSHKEQNTVNDQDTINSLENNEHNSQDSHILSDKNCSSKGNKTSNKSSQGTMNQLRRSVRQRFPVLNAWKNERLVYRYEKGIPKLIRLDKGQPNYMEENFKKIKRKVVKNKVKHQKNKKIYIVDILHNKEVVTVPLKAFSSMPWIEKALDSENSSYRIKKVVQTSNSCFGYLEIDKHMRKPPQFLPEEDLHMTLLQGEVIVFMQKNCFQPSVRDMFIIPGGVAYSIENTGNTKALLLYAVGKFKFLESLHDNSLDD